MIKSKDVCARCVYGVHNPKCKNGIGSDCIDCSMRIKKRDNGKSVCRCNHILNNTECPYFEEVKNDAEIHKS